MTLKELRESKDLSQEQMANKLEIAYGSYRQYESGKTLPPINVLRKISEVFDVPLKDLSESLNRIAGHNDSVEEAAKLWHVGINRIRQWCQDGFIDGAYINGRWHIPVGTENPRKLIDTCIICRQKFTSNNPASKEHIIPESWGNHSFITKRVCRRCNNALGTYVDNGLLDNYIAILTRYVYRIPNKSGRVPTFLNAVEKSEDGKVYEISGSDIRLKPIVKRISENHYRIDTPDIESALPEIRKKLERDGYTKEQIDMAIANMEVGEKQRETPSFKKVFKVDFVQMYLAAAKIAYETACEMLPDSYISDPIAIKLDEMLQQAMEGKLPVGVDKYVKIGGFPQIEALKPFIDSIGYLHMVSISPSGDGELVGIVSICLEPAFTFVVRLSTKLFVIDRAHVCLIPKKGNYIWM